MKKLYFFIVIWVLLGTSLFIGVIKTEAASLISERSQACLACHTMVSSGIVADWKRSLHAQITPAEALKKEELKKRISVKELPKDLANTAVGCAECHTLNSKMHEDNFEHNGYKVHVVVTPKDCASCHQIEVNQYHKNIMAYAHINLTNNLLYRDLMDAINGIYGFKDKLINFKAPDEKTKEDSCFFCHGTEVKTRAMEVRETILGEMEFPLLSGWPNQGVGRLNPDGGMGSCTACHSRHHFSIELARKPHTCSKCHKGPDVPAYSVYMVSKHGNIYASLGKDWDFKAMPWKVGKDFSAPTCASCHISLIANEGGEVIAERTHQINDRLAFRIFGLIYAHPHPNSPNTSIIKNKAGLPLPTEFSGELVSNYLIDAKEQNKRWETMKKICLNCHDNSWVNNYYSRFKNTIKTTNQMTLTATKILFSAWEKGVAKGLAQKGSIFNETIERKWVEQWLFFANSTRFASAMGGADYGVFAHGRWYMSKNIMEMADWLEFKLKEKEQRSP
jgi:hypothetical protein